MLPDRFTFPGDKPSGFSKRPNPHSQRRDRVGFAPNFPVRPLRAPENFKYAGRTERLQVLRESKPRPDSERRACDQEI
jgi:hypothetical protein